MAPNNFNKPIRQYPARLKMKCVIVYVKVHELKCKNNINNQFLRFYSLEKLKKKKTLVVSKY